MARPTRPSAVKRASTLKVRVLVAQRALLYPCAPLSAAAVGGVRVVAFVGGGFMTRALAVRGLSNGLSSDILSHVTDIHATVLALTADDGSEDDDTTQVEAVLDGSAGETAGDGVDLWAALTRGASAPRTEVLINRNSATWGGGGALRRGRWKLIVEVRWSCLLPTRSRMGWGR